MIQLDHPGIDHTLHARMHEFRTVDHIHHRIFNAPPTNQKIPRRVPDMGLTDFLNRHDTRVHITHSLIVKLRGGSIMGHHRHLDFFEIVHVLDLDMEMARDDIALLRCFHNIDILHDPKVRAVKHQRTGHKVIHDHIAGHVAPLIK